MALSLRKKFVLLISILLGLTFFAFVDSKYRGWDDTNQYQIEARTWAQGNRPPAKELLSNTSGLIYQFSYHGPPFVPYVWSFLIRGHDDRADLVRIKVLQALLLAMAFVGLVYYLGLDLSALTFATLLFINGFFRECVSVPVTEPQSLFLLTLGYLLTGTAGLAAVFQAVTRTQVAVLQGPLLWRKKPSKLTLVLGAASLVWALFFFRDLVRGSSVRYYGRQNYLAVLENLASDSSGLLFRHLFPYQGDGFQNFWLYFIAFSLLGILIALRKNRMALLCVFIYILVTFSVMPQGTRYFLPLFLFLLLEFKPELPKGLFLRIPLLVLAAHLIYQQAENIFEFRRFPVPETENPGLVRVREWVATNPDEARNLLMVKFRYCINYFRVQCYTYPDQLTTEGVLKDIREKNIDHLVLTKIQWLQVLEEPLEARMNELFVAKGLSLSQATRHFDGAEVIDLRPLLK